MVNSAFSVLTVVLLLVHKQSINGKPAGKEPKQIGLQFPLLGGAGVGGAGGLFGQVTSTRTVVRTVSTITVASYRTCSTTQNNLLPCGRRKKREVTGELDSESKLHGQENDREENDIEIEPTTIVIRGTERITDPNEVARLLNMEYPDSFIGPSSKLEESDTTIMPMLYPSPSHDEGITFVPDNDEGEVTTTGTPLGPLWVDVDEKYGSLSNTSEIKVAAEHARLGIGGTTTTTVTLSITGIAYTAATGAPTLTFTLSYLGCLPPTLLYSGVSLCAT